AGRWPATAQLPGIVGAASAINSLASSLIYVGTTSGQVYRLAYDGSGWSATPIHAVPLPGQWIWDVAPLPEDPDTVIVVMSGFGSPHVWRGVVPASGPATWLDISGSDTGRLPDIPVNALAIDPIAPVS